MNFVRKCRLFQGERAGEPFPLTHWQDRLLRRVYGDTDESGRRRIRTVFVLAGRGQGKSTLAAALGLLHMGPERDPGAQVIVAATNEEETDAVFEAAAGMVDQSPKLSSVLKVTTGKTHRQIRHAASRSTFRAVSGTPRSGRAVSCFIADELWSWSPRRGRDTFSLIRTSMAKRREPLTWIITMAGRGRHGLAWEYLEYARNVAKGHITDPSFLPVLLEAPHDADWSDESVWRAYNPAIDAGYLNIDELRAQAAQAAEIPFEREEFKRLFLSIWQDGHVDGWIDMPVWDEGGRPFSLHSVRHLPCWLGVDLSTTEDLTAVTALWRDGEGEDARYYTRPFIFVPDEDLRERAARDGAPYAEWIDQGLMTTCRGRVINFRQVRETIMRLSRLFDVRGVGFDRKFAAEMMLELQEEGLPVIEVQQGWVSQVPAVERLERAILSRRLCHAGNPALRWMVDNVAVKPAAGAKMLQKRDRTSRIDAVAGLWMAYFCEMHEPPKYVPLYTDDVEGLLSLSVH